jgi:hypothetical protein
MNKELEGYERKRLWHIFKVISWHLPGKTKKKLIKTSVRIAGLRTEI